MKKLCSARSVQNCYFGELTHSQPQLQYKTFCFHPLPCSKTCQIILQSLGGFATKPTLDITDALKPYFPRLEPFKTGYFVRVSEFSKLMTTTKMMATSKMKTTSKRGWPKKWRRPKKSRWPLGSTCYPISTTKKWTRWEGQVYKCFSIFWIDTEKGWSNKKNLQPPYMYYQKNFRAQKL